MKCKCALRNAACFMTGLAFSSAHPAGFVFSVALPALVLKAETRRHACIASIWYYAGASWPIVLAVGSFFGAKAGIFDGLALWAAAALLLSLPWLLVWTNNRTQHLWRAPVGLLFTVVPPLGLIGWASPVSAAGYLFPGTAWFGILGVLITAGGLASYPRLAVPLIVLCAAILNASYVGPSKQFAWEGVDTHFTGVSQEGISALDQLNAVEAIQRAALNSNARVIVFPETVVPEWSEATDAFWARTLARLSSTGKTIIVGARLNDPAPKSQFSATEFAATMATLRGASPSPVPIALRAESGFRNVLIIRGASNGVFEQRVPVPLGMWKPMATGGVPLRFREAGVLSVAGERAAVLICYEQLLTWPILASMFDHPTVIVAVANDHWTGGTTIPKAQMTAVRALARLNSISYVSATNY
jgi:predicted amidohydrolase